MPDRSSQRTHPITIAAAMLLVASVAMVVQASIPTTMILDPEGLGLRRGLATTVVLASSLLVGLLVIVAPAIMVAALATPVTRDRRRTARLLAIAALLATLVAYGVNLSFENTYRDVGSRIWDAITLSWQASILLGLAPMAVILVLLLDRVPATRSVRWACALLVGIGAAGTLSMSDIGLPNGFGLLLVLVAIVGAVVQARGGLSGRARVWLWAALAAWLVPWIVGPFLQAVAGVAQSSVAGRLEAVEVAMADRGALDHLNGPVSLLLMLGVLAALHVPGHARRGDWACALGLSAVLMVPAWGFAWQAMAMGPVAVLEHLRSGLFTLPQSILALLAGVAAWAMPFVAALASVWLMLRWDKQGAATPDQAGMRL